MVANNNNNKWLHAFSRFNELNISKLYFKYLFVQTMHIFSHIYYTHSAVNIHREYSYLQRLKFIILVIKVARI